MFSLASTSTVQFAKDYRAEQIRTADRARTAGSFRGSRNRLFRSAIAAVAVRFERQTRSGATSPAALSETVGA